LSVVTTHIALTDAYIRYRSEIYRFLVRRTGSHCDAEELTQQVFADATSALSSGEPPRSMKGWLYAVAERRAIDELRRRRRAAEAARAIATDCAPAADATADALVDALRRLSEIQRLVLLLHVVEGRTFREIAGVLDCTEAACKMQLARALRRVRDDLGVVS
jgi:RNA polymerase sigma-70 factor (ECF subfamily)